MRCNGSYCNRAAGSWGRGGLVGDVSTGEWLDS